MGIDESRLGPQERKIYRKATELLKRDVDAPAFSARFFGPESELAQLGTSREERQAILHSELYRWLKARYEELRFRDAGRFEQETRAASGRLTVVVPRSLHAALKGEAASEGVSLSELIRLKLAVPYRQMTDLLVPRGLAEQKLRSARSR
ncbi:MAG: toxin-antitoxin system HicB family antitoxin [bacterium]|nr:toxin-antitoxin system HicB family antitoxin [bacterium]